jgi:hypothetical protein
MADLRLQSRAMFVKLDPLKQIMVLLEHTVSKSFSSMLPWGRVVQGVYRFGTLGRPGLGGATRPWCPKNCPSDVLSRRWKRESL